MNTKAGINRVFALLILTALFAEPAYAYIDPNTQGIISQSITPLFVLGAAVMMFFREKASNAIHWVGRCFSRLTHGPQEKSAD
jgi:hypothetical protein